MAYYSYYQNSHPTWGTQQYQPVPPPMPQYQPQPSWHGIDYYRAHANSLDNTLFDYVWSKVRKLVTGTGIGRNETVYWWKRVYGGLVDLSQLLPRDIGAAAGYEAIRCWEYHSSIYMRPLSADREREKEALVGLATAEAERLWIYVGRPHDKYGRMEASEVAASTATRIFTENYDDDSLLLEYDHRPRVRRSSFSDMRYDPNAPDDDAFLDPSDYHSTPLSGTYHRSTRRSHSRRSPSPISYRTGAVGFSSSVTPYIATYPVGAAYATGFGAGIPGTYYPGYSAGAGYRGASPYMHQTYAGSSVGLPPPPTDQFLSVPSLGHRRTHSAGSYGAARPTFGY